MTYVLCLSSAVMASIELYRNPLAEEIEIDRLISLGPVQPKDVNFKVTTVLVRQAEELEVSTNVV